MIKVDRPTPDNKRINHKDSFEECYLRHQYIRRAKHNPTIDEMKPYNHIIENFAKNTYFVYKSLFMLVGLDLDDVTNAAQVHLVSYLGLFAIERKPEKLANFKRTFRSHNSIVCKKEDILNKNRADFTCFLKQRLEDMVRVCRQKARNIKGLHSEEFIVFSGTKQPPKDIEDLLENHSKHGYKSLGTSAFKSLKKKMKNKQEGPVYLDDGVWYVCVPIRKKTLSFTDFTCNNADPYDNLHNMTPEEIFERSESRNFCKDNYSEFNSIPDKDKIKIVRSFVEENKENKFLKEEVDTAKRLLENLNVTNI